MARRCELTGKAVQVGHKVSHSNHKTKTRFLPNLCNVTLISDTLNRSLRVRIAAASLRSVEHRGGLDGFLAKAHDHQLSQGMRVIKREIAKKQAAAAQAGESHADETHPGEMHAPEAHAAETPVAA